MSLSLHYMYNIIQLIFFCLKVAFAQHTYTNEKKKGECIKND